MATKKKTKKKSSTKRKSTKKAAGGRGKRLSDADKKKRVEMLKKHGSKGSPNPWPGQKIADALGISLGTWAVWKSLNKKGGPKKATAKKGRGRPRKMAAATPLEGLLASVKDLQAERDSLYKALQKVQSVLDQAL